MSVDCPVFYFLAALAPLLLPFDWLVAAVAAGIIHESCHLLLLLLCGGKVSSVQLGINGCEIRASSILPWQQFICILAGPLGSFSLLLLYRVFPKLALCGLIHGVYNLLPVFPLDGGRLLGLLVCRFFPDQVELVLYWSGIFLCALLFVLLIWMMLVLKSGIGPVICGILLLIKLFPRKIPCKPSEIGVQ